MLRVVTRGRLVVGVVIRGRLVVGVVIRGRLVAGVVTRGRLVVVLGVVLTFGGVSRRAVGSKMINHLVGFMIIKNSWTHLNIQLLGNVCRTI